MRPLLHGARSTLARVANRLARPHRSPVFVLGNHRSGTTAIAALLGKVSGSRYRTDVFYRSPRNEGEPFSAYVDRNRRIFRNPVVKDPNFTFMLDELRERFPLARFVYIVRDPRDNIRSILNRVGLPGTGGPVPPAELERIRATGWRWTVADIDARGEGDYVATLAERWNEAARVYAEHRDELILIRYEDFVAEKVGAIERLARAAGLSPTEDIRADVDTEYQKPGTRYRRGEVRDVGWHEFYGPDNLGHVESLCADGMKLFGYEANGARSAAGADAEEDGR